MKMKGNVAGAKSLPASIRSGSSGSASSKGHKLDTKHLTHGKPAAKGHSKKDVC